jgi:hypothetical protein
MQFTENVQANWQEGYCFIMTMPDPTQPNQPRRELKNYSGNFLNIRLRAWTWPLVTSTSLVRKKHLGCKCFTDDEEVKMEVMKWLRQQSTGFYAVGFDVALAKQWNKCINVGGEYVEK